MKQFKLKKWYPGLPKQWKEGTIVGQGDRGTFGNYSPVASNILNYYVPCAQVENNPEYWEKVKEVTIGVTIKTDSLSITTKEGTATYSRAYREDFCNELQREINNVTAQVKDKWIKRAETDLKGFKKFSAFCITDHVVIG